MGLALENFDEDAVKIWCYCCEKFKPHTIFGPLEEPEYYECLDCGCVIDQEDEVIYPENE